MRLGKISFLHFLFPSFSLFLFASQINETESIDLEMFCFDFIVFAYQLVQLPFQLIHFSILKNWNRFNRFRVISEDFLIKPQMKQKRCAILILSIMFAEDRDQSIKNKNNNQVLPDINEKKTSI